MAFVVGTVVSGAVVFGLAAVGEGASVVSEYSASKPGPGIGGGFDSTSSHRPIVGTFDRFNGLSSNISLTFSCYFNNSQMPWGGAFEQKLSAQFKCPTYAQLPPPQQLNIDRCITHGR